MVARAVDVVVRVLAARSLETTVLTFTFALALVVTLLCCPCVLFDDQRARLLRGCNFFGEALLELVLLLLVQPVERREGPNGVRQILPLVELQHHVLSLNFYLQGGNNGRDLGPGPRSASYCRLLQAMLLCLCQACL